MKYLATILLGFTLNFSFSQDFLSWKYADRYFSLQTGSGHPMYLGELNSNYKVQNKPALGSLALEARLLSRLSARLEGVYYQLKAGDYNADPTSLERQRNLSFFSNNIEATLQSVWFMKPYGGDYFRRWLVDPYLSLGVGLSSFNPKAQFNGNIYELRPLQTENIEYKESVLIVPAAVGLKLKINDFINLNLEIAYRYTFTDYLDDVSTTYPTVEQDNVRSLLINRKNEIDVVNPEAYQQLVAGARRGNPNNKDQYILLGYRLEFYIPTNKGSLFKKTSAK